MEHKYSISLRQVVAEHELEIIYRASDYDSVRTSNVNVSRPSLQLVGFYDYFDQDRLRLWGNTETAFLATLPEERQQKAVDDLFARKIPALIVCNRVEPHPLLLRAAEKYDVTLLRTEEDTSEMISRLSDTLRAALSPRTTIHGVLVQVHGEGLLITGESGIGKSEVALELIKRGHRLVADDAVELRRTGRNDLLGTAPKMIRYLMELRGVGLIDVQRIYGVGAVLPRVRVDFCINFVHWDENREYDRLGLEEESLDILGVSIPQITVPVAAARNLAIICEVAAMNHRQKELGYNTAEEFLRRHDRGIDSGTDEDFRD